MQNEIVLEGAYTAGPLFAPKPRRVIAKPYSTTMPGIVRRSNERRASLSGWKRRELQYDKLQWWKELRKEVRAIYAEAERLTNETGVTHSVDHIVPLCSPIVCGLHVPWNMRVIPLNDNIGKSNSWWPDMPLQQLPLLEP